MATTLEYMKFSLNVYVASDQNLIGVPSGWTRTYWQPDLASGFSAGTFVKGNELVISFTGTNDFVDKLNWTIGLNIPAPQLFQAVDFYFAAKAANPGATNITFTGHSLGGGLAALMAVYFNKQATVFDEAPFELTARNQEITELLADYMIEKGYQDAAFDSYRTYNVGLREVNISHHYLEGEILDYPRFSFSTLVGFEREIDMGVSNATGVQLHSMALMTAIESSSAFYEAVKKLPDLVSMLADDNLFGADPTTRNIDLLRRLLRHQFGVEGSVEVDNMLTRFASDMTKLAQDGGLTMTDGNPSDAALNNVSKTLIAFAMQMYYEDTPNAKDATKQLFTAVTGGVTFDMADVSQKILAAFTQSTPVKLNEAKGYKEYFSQYLNGAGTNFTEEERSLISSMLPTMRDWYVQAGATGMNTTDTHNRHAFMLGGATNDNLTGGNKLDLLVGNAGNDTVNGGDGDDVLIGGTGQDTLHGDAGNDTLLGGADVDILDGGEGNDQLKGDEGVDVYQFNGSFGTDVITDTDGKGFVTINSNPLNSATKQFENIYKNEATGYTVTKLNGGASLALTKEDDTSSNPGRIIINDWSEANNLSISLTGDLPDAPTATLTGDFKKKLNDNGAYLIENNNYVNDGAEANALDLINGTVGTDAILGLGGDDYLNGKSGDDYIDGGTGSDFIQGGLGKDTINGGTGDDIIYGSSDLGITMPGAPGDLPSNNLPHPQATGLNWISGYYSTYSNGVPDSYTDAPRNRLADDESNLINGGAGNDFIAAGTGADYVHGGEDKDLIIGMDKDDILFGDGGNDVVYGDGDNRINVSVIWTLPDNHGNDIIDGGDGDDILFGQGKDDIIFGGKDNDKIWGDDQDSSKLDPNYHGNDYIDGGDGNDQLVGGGKDDILMGSNGNDTIWGDDVEANLPKEFHGNDVLNGGKGNDTLYGGTGNDYLDGGEDDDTLLGGDGNDTLVTNSGNDVLAGGANDDTYLINSAGIIRISDTEGNNTLRFGANVNPENLKLRLGSLMLDFGNGNQVHIENFNQSDVFNSTSFSSFEFADGTTLTSTELLARGFDLDGTDAVDSISGTNITDRMNGLAGNDTMTGGDGNDVMNGGAGNDHVQGDAGDDVVDGGEGDDSLLGLDGNDNLLGGVGNDELQGNSGNDVLDGGAGNDTLFGQSDADILDGGLGNDVLLGNAGDDVYQFNLGGGQDTVWEEGDTAGDVLHFGQGIVALDIFYANDNGSLMLIHNNGTDQVRVANWFVNTSYQLSKIEFADGTFVTNNAIVASEATVLRGTAIADVFYGEFSPAVIFGLEGDDDITGSYYDDILVGGQGYDEIWGGYGDDTYKFGLGDGFDDIYADNYDTIRFLANIQSTNITAERIDNNLVLTNTNGSDGITLMEWYASVGNQVKEVIFEADGTTWSSAQLSTMGTDISHNYTFNIGDGAKLVNDWGGTDSLIIGTGILDSDVTITRANNNLVLTHANGVDSISIVDWFNDPTKHIETIQFAESGNVLTASQLTIPFLTITGTATNNVLVGGNFYGETILGLEGDDRLYGMGGNDIISGGDGIDYLSGGAGNDVLMGDAGIDTLYGGGGDDYLDPGAGTSNVLYGEEGDDTLLGGVSGYSNTLNGGVGNDAYIYMSTVYNSSLYVRDDGGDDKISFGDGINAFSLGFRVLDNYDLDIHVAGLAYVTITNQFKNITNKIERLVFADGSSLGLGDVQLQGWNTGDSVLNVLNGTAEDSILTASAAGVTLNGGDGNDLLQNGATVNGGNGDDWLVGDTMNGGAGNDNYFVDYRNDVVTELVNEGTDTVYSSIAYTLGSNVENLTLTGTASIKGTGNALDNVFRGNSAANAFTGGAGNDTYYLSTGDSAVEGVGAGTDVVYTDATYTMGTNIENGFIIGTAAVNLTGNALANIITGNAAANILNGGAGVDTLTGGLGDDTYIIDVATDVVVENASEGNDTIQVGYATTAATTLTTGVGQFTNIENITVTGTGLYNLTGDAANNTLIGNASANVLTGNAGNDVLNGLAGIDNMSGGFGNDTYTVDVAGDVVTENLNEGTDLVNVAITTKSGTYTLGNNVENGTLINAVAFTLTGNALDNILNGNGVANTLNGGDGNDVLDGKAGSDNMSGGLGNDTYFVDVTGDVVTEAVGAGTDSVNVGIATASGTYTLGANIENGKLTNTVAFNLTGNVLNNYLMGNIANNTLTDTAGGNDILQGLAGIDTFNDTVGNNLFDGGVGNDIMTGGSGRDLFIGGLGVDTITSGTGYDVIAFNKGDGQDTVNASTGADNTLSLGGNFAYSDLSLTKSTNDLILKMGTTDQITLKDWYLGTTNTSVVNLQVIAEAMQGFSLGSSDDLRNNKIENFNFADIVSQFDAEGAAANWQLTDARLTAHLQSGSDSAAIGGDMAYQYGMNSNLTGMGLSNAQSIIAAASFGQTAQTLNNPSVWQAEVVKLA